MDSKQLFSFLRDDRILDLAFRYAIHDRKNSDFYFDYFEIEYCESNKVQLLEEVKRELLSPREYKPGTAYAFYPPKTDLCYRRMVYVPMKDLVVRYALVILLAHILDDELASTCFANRRASRPRSTVALLEDFAVASWPRFCDWQRDEAQEHCCLLRTDISSFYDSISHAYIQETVARLLAIRPETEFLQLFGSLLQIPVESYCHAPGSSSCVEVLKQGLPIGSAAEGYLANLYLKEIDDLMNSLPGVSFGRYNDDMRIFTDGRERAKEAILILQERMLTKGLNLNASKTRFADSKLELTELRSKYYEGLEYGIEDEQVTQVPPIVEDRHFDEFARLDIDDKELTKGEDAKDFCRLLNTNKQGKLLKPLSDREPRHVERLFEILKVWQGSSKFASWLLVQSAFWPAVPVTTRDRARELALQTLESGETSSYAKYRILHHLVKPRANGRDRYLDKVTAGDRVRLVEVVRRLLSEPAFELNHICLYVLKILGCPPDDLRMLTSQMPQPLAGTIRDLKFRLDYSVQPLGTSPGFEEEEPDGRPEPY